MWKRIGTVVFIAAILFTAWAIGKWLVEPPSHRARYDIASAPVWSASASQRRAEIENAKKEVSSALDQVKRYVEKESPRLNQRLRLPASMVKFLPAAPS